MDFPKQDKHKAIKEVALEGLKGMENLIQTLSHHPFYLNTKLIDITISKFKKLIALLNQTSHVRFKHASIHSPAQVHSLNPVHNASTSSI